MIEPSLPEESVFAQALEIPSAAERAAFLDRACGDDAVLRGEVEALLRAHERSGDVLDLLEDAQPTTDLPGDENPGTIIGPYKLLEKIGEGGMGTVYMAQQSEPVKRLVALKLIKPGMDSRHVIARFQAERQALALMDHPNIARVFDGGTTKDERGGVSPGRPYFVMELVKGVPLTKYCDEHRLTPKQRLELFVPVCQAIQHAHQKGIIHRDIKPSNVLVALYDGKPVPKVIDFGVAKATGQQLTEQTLVTGFGAVLGTLEYMSPEQAELNQLDIDTRSDIYSLGVLLYELLTGTTPLERKRFKNAALMEVLRSVREDEPPRPSTRLSTTDELPSVAANRGLEPKKLSGLVRGELDWIVMKALEKDRNRRYETANGFALDIQRYLADEAVQACPPSVSYRFRKMVRRNKAAMTMVAMFSVALLIGVAALSVSTVLTSHAYTAEQEAHQQSEANLKLTRRAIEEFYTKVSQSKLLDVPGLQPLRKDLLESAVRFQHTLAAERPDDPTVRADLAAAYLRVAVLYFEINRNDDCQASMNAAVEVVEQLRREHPSDRELYRRVASYFKAYRPLVGPITAWPKDVAGFARLLERFTRLWEQMAAEDPETPGFRRDLAAVYAFRADLRGTFEGRAKGIADCRRSLALLEELNRAKPDEPEDEATLALVYAILAHQLRMSGQNEEQIAAADKALALRERLVAKHGDVPQYQKDLCESLSWKATRLLEQGKDKEAESLGQRIVRELEALVDEYPNASNYRDDLATALNSLAAVASKGGRTADGEKLLRRALDIRLKLIVDDPRNANLAYLPKFSSDLAELQRTLGLHEDADRTLKRTFELLEEYMAKYTAGDPREYEYGWELGHAGRYYAFYLLGTGQPKEAIVPLKKAVDTFRKLVEEAPDGRRSWDFLADTYRLLAKTYLANQEPAEAEAALRQFMEIHEQQAAKLPGGPDAEFLMTRGDYRAIRKEWDKAIADYSQAIELAPKQFEPWSADLGHLLWRFGEALSAADRNSEAVKAYQRAAAVFEKLAKDLPKNPFYRQQLADIYCGLLGPLLEKTRRTEDAEQVYRKAVAIHENLLTETWNEPNATRLRASYERLASLLKTNGKAQDAESVYLQAIEFYEKLVTANPSLPDYRRELGQLYIQIGEGEKAAAAFTKVIELKPDDWDARFQRGRMYSKLNQWDKALADYSKAIELDPKRWESWSERGFAHLALRQWDKSIQDYTKAIELAPDVHTNWFHRGLVYGEEGQWDKVISDYSELLKRYPNEYNALHFRAVAYVKLNQPDLAVGDLRQAFAKGYKDLDGVKKDDRFTPLRHREDFKKLLAELEAMKKP